MNNTSVLEKQITWIDFATVKVWRKSLRKHSKKKELSENTWELIEMYFPKFLKHCTKTPDELIEEAIDDAEIGEERIDDFFQFLKQLVSHNSARAVCYGTIQGFYSHNNVTTKKWTSPEIHPSQVKSTDDNFPVWKYNEDEDDFDLNRVLFQDFFNRLNPTYRAVAYAMLGTGQDIGIILERNVGFVRNQDYRHKRLSLNDNRSKTSEIIDGFYSEEATNAARSIVAAERQDALDHEPLYIVSITQRKRDFRKIHGRAFRTDGLDQLPPGNRLDVGVVEAAFRRAQKAMGIKLIKGQQGPLRPKRLRKIFRTAAYFAGVGDDKARQLISQDAGNSRSNVYIDTSREVQERQYMKVERRIWIFKEPELSAKEKEATKEIQRKLDVALQDKDSLREEMLASNARLEQMINDRWESTKKQKT